MQTFQIQNDRVNVFSFFFSHTHPVHHFVYLFVSSCNFYNLSTSNDDTPRFWLYVHRIIMFIGVVFSALGFTLQIYTIYYDTYQCLLVQPTTGLLILPEFLNFQFFLDYLIHSRINLKLYQYVHVFTRLGAMADLAIMFRPSYKCHF